MKGAGLRKEKRCSTFILQGLWGLEEKTSFNKIGCFTLLDWIPSDAMKERRTMLFRKA